MEDQVASRYFRFVAVCAAWLLQSQTYSQSTADILARPLLNPDSVKAFQARFLRDQIAIPPVQSTLAKWNEYVSMRIDSLRSFLTQISLERETPMRVESRGVIQSDGFRIEKYIVKVLKGIEIPMNLYIPDSVAHRLPLILNPNGFYLEGKAHSEVQIRCAHFARSGYIAAAWDFVHSGERGGWNGVGVPGNDGYYALRWRLAGARSLPLTIIETRAILDYLLQLQFVDSSRVAMVGSSQGAMTSLLVSAIDTRIKSVVAVIPPAPFKTMPFNENGMFLETNWFHWVGTFTPGIISRISDTRELMSFVAPRPLLLLSGIRDVVRPSDFEVEVQAARRVYALFGRGDAIAHESFDMGHEFNQHARVRSYEWLRRAFNVNDTSGAIIEEPYQPRSIDELRCGINPSGETILSVGSRLASMLPVPSYHPVTRLEARNMQREIRATLQLGTGSHADSVVEARNVKLISSPNRLIRAVILRFWSGLQIPVVVFSPSHARTYSMVFLLSDSGKASVNPALVDSLLEMGYGVCVSDVLNAGELEYTNFSARIVNLFLELNDRTSLSVAITQARSLIKSVRDLFGYERCAIVADGPMTQLVASVLALDSRVSTVVLRNGLDGIREEGASVFPSRIPAPLQFMGALSRAENAHVSALISPKPLLIHTMKNVQGNTVTEHLSHHGSKVRVFYEAERSTQSFSMQVGSIKQVTSWIVKYLPSVLREPVDHASGNFDGAAVSGSNENEVPPTSQSPVTNAGNKIGRGATTFVIEGAYPNPFNPATTFVVGLNEPASLRLAVYNIVGELVDDVVIGVREEGSHVIQWLAPSHLASGTYFVRFDVRVPAGVKWSETKRVALIR